MPVLQGTAQAQAGRLLRVLFLRQRAVPADPGRVRRLLHTGRASMSRDHDYRQAAMTTPDKVMSEAPLLKLRHISPRLVRFT